MEIAERVASVETDMDNLKRWQAAQNGTIQRVDAKVDRLQYWIMGTTAAAALNLLLLILSLVLK